MTEKTPKGLTFREVDAATWPDMQALFEAPGGPKYCWCMAWRSIPDVRAKDRTNADRKAAMEARIGDGIPVGILAYDGDAPVGWCSIAPRDTYIRSLGGVYDREDENVWSLVCFYVPRKRRRRGLFRALLEAAQAQARASGATVIEAYPVDRDSPSYRFMGFVDAFLEAGFEEVGRAGTRRHVLRKRLRAP